MMYRILYFKIGLQQIYVMLFIGKIEGNNYFELVC